MAGDLYFHDVVLLLHCDGTDGSTTFTDSSEDARTVVVAGNAHVETSDKKWGTASAEFDGTTDSLSVASNAAFNPSGTWTAEFWVKARSFTSQPYLIGGVADPTHRWALQFLNTGALSLYIHNGTGEANAISGTYSTGQWYFIEINNSGSTTTIRVDGASVYSGTPSRAFYGANHALELGAAVFNSNSNSLDGFLDDIRFTAGVARNGTSAPTAAFPDYREVTGTGVLAAQSAAVSGAGTVPGRASNGALTAQSAAVSGVATLVIAGSGALVAQTATITGTGTYGELFSGSGALSAQSATIAGTAVILNGYEATETVVVTEPALDTLYGISAAILCDAQFTTSATLTEALTWGTEETASLSDAITALLTTPLPVTEAANMADVLTSVARFLVTETVTLTETFPEGTQITWDAIEGFLATSSLDVRQTFVEALTASLAAQSLALFATFDSVTETTTLGAVLAEAAAYVHAVVEALAMSETGGAVLNLIFAVDEETTLSEALAAGLHFSDSLVAGLAFVGTLSTDADSTATWVVHPEIPAATTYNNFDFNSFAGVGDTFLGAMTDGIYELTGEDDAGTDIASVVRTGLLELGSSLLKQVTRAYLGYTSDGRLILKTVTTDGGDKTERWYELEETANAVREARIKLGKGVKARYWQFELINADGADFHVDQLQLLPMALSRRVKE